MSDGTNRRDTDTKIGDPWEPAIAPGGQDNGGNGRRRGRIGELGPAWISAIAAVIVALTGAGFFAGRVSAPASSGTQADRVSTTTVPTAAPVSAGTSASASPSGAAATTGNGTLLGSYSFQLTNGYNAPLGPTAPTQSQIAAGGAYDVGYNGDLYAGDNEKMISLPAAPRRPIRPAPRARCSRTMHPPPRGPPSALSKRAGGWPASPSRRWEVHSPTPRSRSRSGSTCPNGF